MRAAPLMAIVGLAFVLAVGVGTPVTGLAAYEADHPRADAEEGRAPNPAELAPAVEAAFQAESYARGEIASLRLFNRARDVRLQFFHVGPEGRHTVGYNEMQGVPMTRQSHIGAARPGRVVRVPIGAWPSGLYFARLAASDGRVGFAPVVIRPRRLGESRVAVVMPTQTWQAYNIRDDDHDGQGDSWYARETYRYARLGRPFLNRGVPYNFRTYDLRFLHWLERNGKVVDFLADRDLDSTTASVLARAYDIIVFPGHHEYVTTREYDAIEGFRDRGGNLVFLSANTFVWQVTKHGSVMERTDEWADLGRPEAALTGVQYLTNMREFGRYEVLDTKAEPWLFAGTDLWKGSIFGHGGIEIDSVSSKSPRNLTVLARIPNVFGHGLNADMTIYRTRRGGMVFSAGAFTLAAGVVSPVVSRIVENLWTRMTHTG